jgi:hypothetical protein
MLMERAAANECLFVSPLLERFLTGVLKNPIATVKWLLHRRGQHRRNELGQQRVLAQDLSLPEKVLQISEASQQTRAETNKKVLTRVFRYVTHVT